MRLWPKSSACADSMQSMPSSAQAPAPPDPPATPQLYGWFFAAMPGLVLGSALQLQQPVLFQALIYLWLMLTAPALLVVGLVWPGRFRGRWSLWLVGLVVAVSAFGLCGWRATVFMGNTLPPALEGRDVLVTGVVSVMPQRNEAGLRLRLAVESAQLDGSPVVLPPLLDLGWYGGVLEDAASEGDSLRGGRNTEPPGTLRAGERWRMLVRLKAPHGLRNPHGFDYELWLWEQGVQATGYVRNGPRDPAPQRLAVTWRHPVEQARQHVRDAVFQRLEAEPGTPETKVAGLVAALVVGDQRAIDRWPLTIKFESEI